MKRIKTVRSMTISRKNRDVSEYTQDFSIQDIEGLLSLEGHTNLEYLYGDQKTKPYFDYDQLIDEEDSSLIAEHKEKVVENANKIAEFLQVGTDCIKYASRHGKKKDKYKISFRVYIEGVTVIYHQIPNLLRHLGQEEFWDTIPYKKKDQLIALPFGKKGGGDNRILRPEPECADCPLHCFIIQHTNDDDRFVDLSSYGDNIESTSNGDNIESKSNGDEVDSTMTHNDERATIKGKAKVGETNSENFVETGSINLSIPKNVGIIKNLLSLLNPKRATNRKTWIDVGIMLKNIGMDINLWIEFSKTCTDPSKVSSDNDFRKTWDSFAGSSSNPLGIGSLHAWAKEDNPVEYSRLKSLKSFAFIQKPVEQEGSANPDIVRAIREHFPDIIVPDDVLFVVENTGLFFKHAGNTYTIDSRDFSFLVNGEYKGMFCSNQTIKRHFSNIDPKIDPQYNEFTISRPTRDQANLTSVKEGMKLELYHPFTPESVGNVKTEGQKTFRLTTKKTNVVCNTVSNDLRELFSNEYPGSVVLFNQCQINIYNNNNPEDERRSEEDLSQLIVDKNPDVFVRWVFVPDLKSANCNGIFYCLPETNTWKQLPNSFMETVLMSNLPIDDLSQKELKHIQSRRGRSDFLYLCAQKCIDLNFKKKLNNNLDIFPLDNILVDTCNLEKRSIQLQDYITMTTGWSYDPNLASEHKADVTSFFEKIIPNTLFRHTFFAFVASLLCGKRAKKFLVLTDKRSGDNGKSMTLSFLEMFFGHLTRVMKTFLLKATNQKGIDEHNAGMAAMQYKRLLLCDEMSSDQTIDTGLIKELTSGTRATRQGRMFGSGDIFEFPWEAGIILSFNEGCLPKTGTGTDDPQSFWKRAIVIPMVSRFEDEVPEDAEPHTYKADKNIGDQFPVWRSAFLDILIEHWDPDVVNSSTAGDKSWVADLACQHNPLKEWLDTHIKVTKNKKDKILRNDVVEKYLESGDCDPSLKKRDIEKFVESYLKAVSVKYEKRGGRINGDQYSNIAQGVLHC